jgi:cytochrome c biogenesis protein CcmG/thiol:disulfide interchange protein DsbE
VLRRLLPLAIFIVLAALLAVGIRMNAGRDMSALPSPLIGKAAPAFALPTLENPSRIVRNADLRGAPYLLNVWGSWCVNCREEHPQITALARSGKIRVIGYNYKDVPEDAQRWLDQFGDPYSVVVADEDGSGAFDWGIYGAPETYLVDGQGIVRWKTVGPISDDVIRDQIEPELAKMSAKP